MKNWQLQDAKARLSEVVRKAVQVGPQRITVPGAAAVVLLSEAEYQRLTRRPERFVEFVRRSPLRSVHLELTRDRSRTRDVQL